MRTIWKYPLEITDEQFIDVPLGSEPLSVQVQNDQLCIWVLVTNHNRPTKEQPIRIYGTGHPVESLHRDYVGTVQTMGGALVWHVFWTTR